MEKEKMIEEMAKVTCGYKVHCNRCQKVHPTECADRYFARTFYDAGYRKVPEGAVVLTKEELAKHDEEIRKEMARGIFSELREFVKNRKHRFDLECNAAEETAKTYDEDDYGKEVFTKILHKKDGAWCECDVIELAIDNLAKKYGVEVEE